MEVVSAVLEKIGKQKNGGGKTSDFAMGLRWDFRMISRDFMGFNSD